MNELRITIISVLPTLSIIKIDTRAYFLRTLTLLRIGGITKFFQLKSWNQKSVGNTGITGKKYKNCNPLLDEAQDFSANWTVKFRVLMLRDEIPQKVETCAENV